MLACRSWMSPKLRTRCSRTLGGILVPDVGPPAAGSGGWALSFFHLWFLHVSHFLFTSVVCVLHKVFSVGSHQIAWPHLLSGPNPHLRIFKGTHTCLGPHGLTGLCYASGSPAKGSRQHFVRLFGDSSCEPRINTSDLVRVWWVWWCVAWCSCSNHLFII